MRRLPGLVAAAFLALHAAASASPAIDGGYCIPPHPGDAWTEVWAEVENRDAGEFRGVLEASLRDRDGAGPSARCDVAVAPGAKKRFSLVLSMPDGRRVDLRVRLTSGGGREVASKSVTEGWVYGPEATLVVVARPEQPAALFASLAARKGRGGFAMWEADEARLPEHLEGWTAAGLVAISGADLGAWSPQQRRSLRQWVDMGGRVLLLPGTDPKWLESAGVKEIVDLGAVSEEDADLYPTRYFGKASPKVVMSFGRPGEVLLVPAGNLARAWPVGSGRVAALAFDANSPALREDGLALGLPSFTEDLLDVLRPTPGPWSAYRDSHGTWYWRSFVDALGRDLVRYPPTAGLLLVLFAYVFLIGPVNFWILRKRHAPALTVLTVPGAAAVIALALLAVGWIGRDGTVRLNRVAIARPEEDGNWVVREHLVALSARRQPAFLASPLGRLSPMTDGHNDAPGDPVFAGADGAAVLRELQPNEPAYFYSIGRREFGPVTATTSGPTAGSLTLVNGSRFDLERAWYYEGGSRVIDLGPVPSGSTWNGELTPGRRRSPFTDYLDESPDALLLRALDPQFMLTTEIVVVAIVRKRRDLPLVNDAEGSLVRDTTVLIIPVLWPAK